MSWRRTPADRTGVEPLASFTSVANVSLSSGYPVGGWDSMDANDGRQKATGLLQELGLREYEAKCFVALAQLPKATAK